MSAALPAPCDAGTVSTARGTTVAHPSATLVATILGSSVAFIDGSVVNVALPTLERAFAGSLADAQWIVNAYLLPLGALVLLGGASGDRFGRRRMFLLGLVAFTVASIICAVAPSLPMFVAARALQGTGAALLVPNSLALLGTFSGEARGRAIGTWAAAGAIAGALGPVVGGWLVDHVGWRAIFLLNVPIAAAAVWLAVTYVAESRDDTVVAVLDWPGAALATGGLAAVTWGLTALPARGGGDAWVTGAVTAGLLALAAFAGVEWRRGDEAMMPLTLFARRTFLGVTLLTLFLYAALAAILVLLPFVLMRVGRYRATAAGAAVLPLPLAVGLASRAVGRWSERVGPRWLLTGGPVIVAFGFALALRVRADEVAYWRTVFPALLGISCGMAITVAPLTATVMAAVDPDHAGAASGINNAVARIGGLVATASIGLLLRGNTSADIISGFRAAALVGAILAILAAASAFIGVAPALHADRRS